MVYWNSKFELIISLFLLGLRLKFNLLFFSFSDVIDFRQDLEKFKMSLVSDIPKLGPHLPIPLKGKGKRSPTLA